MADNSSLLFNRPGLRSPNLIRSLTNGEATSSPFISANSTVFSGSSLGSSSSFKYDLNSDGIKSTQQLNVNWSDFSNHTFFNSAQVKTNVAFDKIFNQFPFDGTQGEVEIFLDGLTGFEKYVYDQFPKNTGYLFLSGTSPSESGASRGTYVRIKDQAGSAFPNVSRNVTGASILNPVSNSMCIEFQLYVPTVINSSSYILHQVSPTTQGFAIYLNSSSLTTSASLGGTVISGSGNILTSTALIAKGQWNHITFVWDRSVGIQKTFLYVNQAFAASSSNNVVMGYLDTSNTDVTLGSGSVASGVLSGSGTSGIQTTFSGAIDELRIWHKIPSAQTRLLNQQKAIYAQDGLKLYYKFNEPSGSLSKLILDGSGNSLHGELSAAGYALGVREVATSSVAGPSPILYEKLALSPVLFPSVPAITTLQTLLLTSASLYDLGNPNLITRLVPAHLLREGAFKDGLLTDEGSIVTDTSSGTDPNSTKLGNTQVLLLLLYTWAKFFDEMKLYIQAFADLGHLDYDQTDTVPDKFLQFYADKLGFQLPALFTGSSIPQFLDAENIDNTISTNTVSLQYVQNQIWRRVLLNLKDVINSKGTIHAVKSFIRSVGIDPNSNFRIREFGGPTTKALLNNGREKRTEIGTMLSFVSGGIIASEILSGTRVEPGFPVTSSNTTNNKLYTSGSMTFEGVYYFPKGPTYLTSQSLGRVMNQDAGGAKNRYMFVNAIANSGSGITLYAQTTQLSSPVSVSIGGFDLMDGNVWSVSFGRVRNDQFQSVSSSYFLRAARSSFGEIVEEHTGSVLYNDNNLAGDPNYLQVLNGRGNFLEIGAGSFYALGFAFLPWWAPGIGGLGLTENFQGRVGQIRFWSKALNITETHEHARNFKSLGVEDPITHFNFNTVSTGSWERLRLDATTNQSASFTDGVGSITIKDYSQNNLNFSGSAFPFTGSVIMNQRYNYSMISPKFDVQSTTDKVRVRSFLDYSNVVSSSYAAVAPVYEIPRSELPQDNTRFTIDFSIIDALDRDIVSIFATLDSLDNIIGNPELVFSGDYPGLENLRDIYFNRLTSKINLKDFFDFYKWFDTNIGSFVTQLIPRKTKFLGTNYVIESHMLERPKMEYLSSEIYLGDNMRSAQKDTILLQLFDGFARRY